MHIRMTRKYLLIVIAFVGHFILLPSMDRVRAEDAAKTAWMGAKVLPTKGAVVKDGKTIVYDGSPQNADLNPPWIVQAVDGELLKVGDSQKGWVHKSQVLPLGKAPAYYTELIAMKRDLEWAYNLRAIAWHELGNTDAAITDYGELIRLAPCALAYNNRGTAWAEKKEYPYAISDFNEAIRIDPSDARAYCNRGCVYGIKEDFDKAFADYDQAIRLNSTDAVAYRGRGLALSAKKEYRKAIVDFDQAIRLDPDLAPAYFGRGAALAAMKEYSKAIADLNQAIRGIPNYKTALNCLAWIQATCPDAKYRDGARAVSNARKACELSGWSDAYLLGTLAAAYAETGDFDPAIKYQQKAIDYDQNNDVLRSHLATLRQRKPIRDESVDTK